jgi:hypothetical protein
MNFLRKFKWILYIIGSALIMYTVIVYFKISGFKLLEMDSTKGRFYLVTYRYTFILGFLFLILAVVITIKDRKSKKTIKDKMAVTDNQGISVDENPLEDMGNKEQEKIEVSEKEG